MKVWVVLPDYDYEGLGAPEHVFDSLEKAETWQKKQRRPRDWEVVEMMVE